MGYCIEQRAAHFTIKAANKEKALKALKKLGKLSWVNVSEIQESKTLALALGNLRWFVDEKKVKPIKVDALCLKAKHLANRLHQMPYPSHITYKDIDKEIKSFAVLAVEIAEGLESLENAGQGGDVVGISFDGEKIGSETEIFTAIAPFVEDGSFIEMSGEDGAIWRYVFKNGEMEEKSAIVSFE